MSKVAYLLGALERGGTETLLLDTLKQVASTKLDCLMVHRKKGSLLPEFQQTGIPLYYYPIGHSLYISYVYRLRKLIHIQGIQVVHAQLPFDAFLAYWACLGTGVKLILSVHGYDIGYSKLARRMVNFVIRRTALNVYVSQHLREYYRTAYALTNTVNQQVVYNGVDFNKFDAVSTPTIRKELSLPSGTLVIGSVGNFVIGRDQLTVCRFLAQLKKAQIDFHFVFVGTRNYNTPVLYDDCVAFCEEHNLLANVHFLGERHDVPAILQALDAFVYASEHDTFGIAVVEAMAVGIPVFVNDWAVMKEITENGRLATLYKTKDVDDLVAIFSRFLQNKDSFQEQATDNVAYVRNTYSIQQHSKNLQEIYQSLVHAG